MFEWIGRGDNLWRRDGGGGGSPAGSGPTSGHPYPSPAAVANQRASTERGYALNLLANWLNEIRRLKVPYNEKVLQTMINKEIERTSAATTRLMSQERRSAAASGLGVGGGYNRAERELLELSTRRNVGTERDIRARGAEANAQFQLSAASLAGQPISKLAGVHLGTEFELPGMGYGSLAEGMDSDPEGIMSSLLELGRQPSGKRLTGKTPSPVIYR